MKRSNDVVKLDLSPLDCNPRKEARAIPEQSLFFYTPLNGAPRRNARDLVRLSAHKLAQRTRALLTMSAEYAERVAFEKMRDGPWPVKVPQLRTRQLECLPFESGRNTLPGMEHFVTAAAGRRAPAAAARHAYKRAA